MMTTIWPKVGDEKIVIGGMESTKKTNQLIHVNADYVKGIMNSFRFRKKFFPQWLVIFLPTLKGRNIGDLKNENHFQKCS